MNFSIKQSALKLAILSSLSSQAMAQETPGPSMIDRLPEHLLYLYTSAPAQGAPDTLQQLVAGGRVWEPGRTLRVCLFQGNKTVAALIREVASEWNAFSSTKFEFGKNGTWYDCLAPNNGFFQVRVGFSSKGFWSVIGKHADSQVDNMAPTMNFMAFNRYYSESRFSPSVVTSQAVPYDKATIRHEFGHALGLLHEAANPKLNCHDEIRWTGPNNVYDVYGRPPNSWTADEVERNMGFIALTDPDYVQGDEDLQSVMFYSLDPEILIAGENSKCYTPPNYAISKKDGEFIAHIYPAAGASILADVSLKTSNLKALPQVISDVAFADTQARVVADLESTDTYTRRDARVRLSELVSKDPSGSRVAQLLRKLPQASYRYQLGVSEALANSINPVKVDSATKAAIVNHEKDVKDKTLKTQLKGAINKLDQF